MSLAYKLLDFFDDGWLDGDTLRPHSLLDFVKKYPEETHKVYQISAYSKKLENENLINHMGSTNGPNPYYVHHYYTNKANYDKELGQYGSYDLLLEGLISIRNRFRPLVLALSVTKANDDLSVGSSFVYTPNIVITARHCIEGLKKIALLNNDGNPIPVQRVYFPANDRLDIAILVIEETLFNQAQKITIAAKEEHMGVGEMDELNFIGEESCTIFAPGKILDDILTLGYPPISGFESILIADKSSINSVLLRTSEGQILAEEKKYHDGIEYLLINAKVKGGNSGGPIFDKLGRIVGMIVEIPTDFENHAEIDKLGYGLAIPAKSIKNVLDGIRSGDGSVIELKVNQLENGSFNVGN